MPSLFFAMKLRVVLLPVVKTAVLVGALQVWCAQAQMATPGQVWRCGQLFTNQPLPGQVCEPLAAVSPTVVEGTRVNRASPTSPSPAMPKPSEASSGTTLTGSAVSEASGQQARMLLQAELREQEARWQQLQRQWNQGQPQATPQQPVGSAAYQERVASLREQLQRTEADLAALRRELARLP